MLYQTSPGTFQTSLADTISDLDGDGTLECDPIKAGRYLCDALGNRLSSILGANINYNTLNSGVRPTRGRSVSLSAEWAGLGGDVKYLRFRGRAQQFWNLFNSGFIFSLSLEGGIIEPLEKLDIEGRDDILLTDRFQLGEPRFRGFDIRGVGPRVLRQFYLNERDEDGNVLVDTNRDAQQDDALGGRKYYLGRAEIEIPLGTGARELGLRPSVFMDIGALWGLKTPVLQDTLQFVEQVPVIDDMGNPVIDENGNPVTEGVITDNPNAADGTPNDVVRGSFREVFLGNSSSPRITIGAGVNWNSPFGPFRIDFAHTIRKVEGDDDKTLTFNVGTQF